MSSEQEKTTIVKAYQEELSNRGLLRHCGNCEHANFEENKCALFNATPPMRVVVVGCGHWTIYLPF